MKLPPDLVILANAGIHWAWQRASWPIQIPCRAKVRLDTRLRGYDEVLNVKGCRAWAAPVSRPRAPGHVILAKAGIHRACQRASKPVQVPCRAKVRLDTRLRGYDGVLSTKWWRAWATPESRPRVPGHVILANAGIHWVWQRTSRPVQIPCRARVRLDTRLRGYDGVNELA